MNKNKKRGWWRGSEGEAGGEGLPNEVAHPPGIPPDEGFAAPPRPDDPTIDTIAIFEAAGISSDDCERVDRARALLQALPHSGPPAVRKEIVETALKAFGVPTDRIVEAAKKETEALEAFIRTNQESSDRMRDDSRARIHAFEQEILRVKQAAEQAAALQEKRIRLANTEMIAVQQVLGFFGTPSDDSAAEVDLEEVEPTRDRSDMSWGVQLPIPPAKPLPRPGGTTPPKPGSKG